MATRYPKERMHRIKYTKLMPDQILAKLKASSGPPSASPLSAVFAGTSLTIVLDGEAPALAYTFTGYGALTLDRIAFFTHLREAGRRLEDPARRLAHRGLIRRLPSGMTPSP